MNKNPEMSDELRNEWQLFRYEIKGVIYFSTNETRTFQIGITTFSIFCQTRNTIRSNWITEFNFSIIIFITTRTFPNIIVKRKANIITFIANIFRTKWYFTIIYPFSFVVASYSFIAFITGSVCHVWRMISYYL